MDSFFRLHVFLLKIFGGQKCVQSSIHQPPEIKADEQKNLRATDPKSWHRLLQVNHAQLDQDFEAHRISWCFFPTCYSGSARTPKPCNNVKMIITILLRDLY